VATAASFTNGGPLWLFVVTSLAPDVSMVPSEDRLRAPCPSGGRVASLLSQAAVQGFVHPVDAGRQSVGEPMTGFVRRWLAEGRREPIELSRIITVGTYGVLGLDASGDGVDRRGPPR